MRYSGIAIIVGGLLAAGAAAAQTEIAVAVPAPQRDFVVFADKGQALSPTAIETLRAAASEASGARQVTLVGRAENIAPVKGELVRQGVPAQAIKARPENHAPIAKAADGLSDPIDRRVEIKF
ncbi:MAG TPA: hypothetical protein VLA02_11875 [Reyranella sp.]|nr:hypothetical protein [Reyranella sp.]